MDRLSRIHQQLPRHPSSQRQSPRNDNHVSLQLQVEEQRHEVDQHGESDEAGPVGLPGRAVEVSGEYDMVVDRNKPKRHL
jgi:hypothetical protein